jgi:3-hydroxyacyl-CoA dehydrogenase
VRVAVPGTGVMGAPMARTLAAEGLGVDPATFPDIIDGGDGDMAATIEAGRE